MAGVAVAVVLASQGEGQKGGNISPEEMAVLSSQGHAKGAAAAPVTIVEFADFQCPACRSFERLVGPVLQQEYLDTGKARLVFRHLPFIGAESMQAAIASECAADQGRFWEYHDLLFQRQGQENSGAFSRRNLVAFAQELGLAVDAFSACMDSQRHQDTINQSTSVAKSFGVRATPTLFTKDGMVEGVPTVEQFRSIMAAALQ